MYKLGGGGGGDTFPTFYFWGREDGLYKYTLTFQRKKGFQNQSIVENINKLI